MECNKRLSFQFFIIILSLFAIGYFLSLVYFIGTAFPDSGPQWRFYTVFIVLAPLMAIIGAYQANNHVVYFNLMINIILLIPLLIWLVVSVIMRLFMENEEELESNSMKLTMIGIPCILLAAISYLENLFYSYLKRKEDIDEKLKNIEEATHF